MSTPARLKWGRWILINAAVAASQIYLLGHPLDARPQSVTALEYLFLASALIGLIGSITMYFREKN